MLSTFALQLSLDHVVLKRGGRKTTDSRFAPPREPSRAYVQTSDKSVSLSNLLFSRDFFQKKLPNRKLRW
ncbi:hypothetical protein [Pseudomonas sichuanensis]|uniref:hypothetical protein n=1 Tax=Pseudomonas sichuanensis TaxID=2213015 RepID=UPI002ACB1594|nr:hypothetical protein [Pseudomonas sichuanensis]